MNDINSQPEIDRMNAILKEMKPAKYKEGWRAKKGMTAWNPTPAIVAKYAKRTIPCKQCGCKEYMLKGLGVEVTPQWECKKCGVLYHAQKK